MERAIKRQRLTFLVDLHAGFVRLCHSDKACVQIDEKLY